MFTRSYTEQETERARVGKCTGSFLKAGRAGARHSELIFEAIQELRGERAADRVGVWLEEVGSAEASETSPAVFRGEVWEGGIGGEILEWAQINFDAPLRIGSLRAGQSCGYEIGEQEAGAILGPELELRRVLWVPVMVRRTLRGLVMLGSLRRRANLPGAKAESIAEQLGFLLELEEERKLASTRKADLDFWLRINRLLAEQQSANTILGQLAESCTRGESVGGAGATFALIGERRSGTADSGPSGRKREDHLFIRAQSGDEAWEYGVNGGPLENLWRQAVSKGELISVDADALALAEDICKIVAIPVQQGNTTVGVLLAGLPRRRALGETLDRLAWRSAMVAEVLKAERKAPVGLQEELWRKGLLESSEQPAVLVDRRGLIVGISKGARELLQGENGLLVSSLESTRFAELFRPQAWEEVQGWVDASLKDSPSRDETLECELSGGSKIVVRRLAISGEGFLAVALGRVPMRPETRSEHENLGTMRQALEWLEEGVAVFDERGEILVRNGMFLQLLGIAGESGNSLVNLEDVIQAASQNAEEPKTFADSRRALAENSMEATQEELEMAKPVPQKMERYARPVFDATGKKIGRVEVYRGVPAWLAFQSKLVQTEGLASLGQRVMQIAHELKNPLTTIVGNAQRFVQREPVSPDTGEAWRILQEAERASRMVKQLLNLPGEPRPAWQLVSLNELVESTMELQRAWLSGSRLRLKLELENGLPRVRGDQGQLQQILLNLLQNAQQAMQESGKGSTLSLRTVSGGSGRVRLEVEDDGPGIPETLQERIFDPFFTTKPPGKGTGLGLAIVSGFVRQHEGTITVHSSPRGAGAKFVVELPAAEETWHERLRQDSRNDNATEIPLLSPAILGKKAPHILVVEDEPTVAALISDVLREEGMEVDVVPDGRKALEATGQVAYDLAICDVKMPGMDGQVFFRALEQAGSPLQEHVLFVTGDEMAQRTRDFLVRNHLPHVAKPFRVEELCRAVRSLLWGSLPSVRPWSETILNDHLGTGRSDEGTRDSAE